MQPSFKAVPDWMCVFLFAVLIGPVSYAAEFYKWVDEDGNTVYSRDPPPAGIEAGIVKAPVKVDTEAAVKTMQEDIKRADSLRDARTKKAEEEQKAQEEIAFREENCRRARTRLASYSVPRGRIVQEDGSQTRPDEETRQAMIKQANEMVAEWCN